MGEDISVQRVPHHHKWNCNRRLYVEYYYAGLQALHPLTPLSTLSQNLSHFGDHWARSVLIYLFGRRVSTCEFLPPFSLLVLLQTTQALEALPPHCKGIHTLNVRHSNPSIPLDGNSFLFAPIEAGIQILEVGYICHHMDNLQKCRTNNKTHP